MTDSNKNANPEIGRSPFQEFHRNELLNSAKALMASDNEVARMEGRAIRDMLIPIIEFCEREWPLGQSREQSCDQVNMIVSTMIDVFVNAMSSAIVQSVLPERRADVMRRIGHDFGERGAAAVLGVTAVLRASREGGH